ncbi:3-dehydroshikimate dehydratase [Cyphellophora attinorum]|uniref:3-dehydroshikimate dehydratase n=1 Tax=Cyphellophora attinorum TaxID=1664694 RepID=A0A0N1H2S0_9EURO|nr:3-dehydroshikimate dehydratase [Phialophora attinorum]KPI35624.1 3-dehydroshikimate dehydratase [Phialophora attinorum]
MTFEPTVASVSLGSPAVHCIEKRLVAAASHGFKGIEIVEADILEQSKVLGGCETDEDQMTAAHSIRKICDKIGLTVRVLQPFWFYEGLLDRREHAAKIAKLHLWMKLAAILGAEIVQIPTNWLTEGTTGDVDVVTADLLEMAEIGLQQSPIIRFALEAVAWGTWFDTWEQAWELIQRVDRTNFGMCLDTYHVAARVFGDPTHVSGRNRNAHEALDESLARMVRELDVSKIFYVQPGDAEKLSAPLMPGHPYYNPEQKARMSWSRNARLFAYEEDRGGCLPIPKIIDTLVVKMGYRGLISAELFSRHLLDAKFDIPEEYAARAEASFAVMLKSFEGRVDF